MAAPAKPPADPPRLDVHLHIPGSTIARLLAAALVVWGMLRIWPEVVFLLLSLLLAITLYPAVKWFDRRGIPQWASVGLIAVALLGGIAASVVLVLPPLVGQITTVARDLPALRARLEQRIPEDEAVLRRVVDEVFALSQSPEVATQMKQPLVWGKAAVSGVMTSFFVLITTLYLLLDGKRFYAWLLAYVPRAHRAKAAATVPEVSNVVFAYVRGQGITSACFGVFVAILLSVLGVPAVLPLAILAALCDVIPVVGIIVAIVPAALLALTVHPSTAAIVVVAYLGYHLFETYFIVPRIYGKTLRLSALAVLLALVVASSLQGILGAVLALPLVAAYPIIEQIWLRGYLGSEVLRDHLALEKAADAGNEEEVVDTVLQGEAHPGERATDLPPSRP